MNNKVIVSFASLGRENYNQAQLRLIKSCIDAGWYGDYLIRSLDGYCDHYMGVPITLGSYPPPAIYNHAEVPYCFKPNIVKEAIDKGYKQIIWCDSTILLVKPPVGTLAHAAKYGVAAFHNLGHDLLPWVSDHALAKQNISESDLPGIKQIMACCICFDIENQMGQQIFNEWYAASRDGVSFQNYKSERPGFIAHRHDQAVMSLILHKHKIPLLPYGKLVYEPHDTTLEYGNEFEFINAGLK